jgi:hypothetical protein
MIMNTKIKSVGIALTIAGLGVSSLLAARATKVADAIWADGRLFSTVLTDTSFKSPPAHSTDVIFNFAESGLTGQRSVAEAAPGNPNYNGGRWHVYGVTFTELGRMIHDPDGDNAVNFELMDAETVLMHAELGHFTIADTGIFFECPLLHSKR